MNTITNLFHALVHFELATLSIYLFSFFLLFLDIKTPASILMIESLCTLITENLSELWHLGQSYLSLQLGEKVEMNVYTR